VQARIQTRTYTSHPQMCVYAAAAGLAARYHEMEAEVFNALLTLISDTAVLRDYQAAALAIVQVCLVSPICAPPPGGVSHQVSY